VIFRQTEETLKMELGVTNIPVLIIRLKMIKIAETTPIWRRSGAATLRVSPSMKAFFHLDHTLASRSMK